MSFKTSAIKDEQPIIDIGSSVVAVSHEKAKSYYHDEISNEGKLRANVPNVILMPSTQVGNVSSEWVSGTFNKIHTARDKQLPEIYEVGEQHKIDVGLIDIQIFFDGDESVINEILNSENSINLLHENLNHLQKLIGSVIHDQMTIIYAMHLLTPSEDFRFHYHNIIFPLRQENEKYCTLSMQPIFDALIQVDKKVNVVA